MKIVILLSLFLFTLPSFAQRFQPVIKPIGLAEKIVIRGFKGKLQLVPTGSETVKVEALKKGTADGSGWTFQVRTKGNILEVVIVGPSERTDWESARSHNGIPEFEMKVTAPQRPIEIFWDEGTFVAEKWHGDLKLQMTRGKVKTSNSQGGLMLQVIKGRVHVANHEGSLQMQSYKGEVIIEKTNGAIHLDNHSATFRIAEHQGPFELKNHSGRVLINKAKGAADVKNISGIVSLAAFEGSFKGDFFKGALNAEVASLQNFRVTSEEAAITLDAPKSSGARVNLRSEKGHMRAPLYIGRNRKGRWTERVGRLKGKEQGNIKIISKYGDIVLK